LTFETSARRSSIHLSKYPPTPCNWKGWVAVTTTTSLISGRSKILPTPNEFASAERPFYRRADAIPGMTQENRGQVHLDNQFRLLREDLLGELRSDFQIATGQRRGRRKFVGCLISNGQGVAFANVDRDEKLLAQKPPTC
jgi:hypothetical protein